MTGAGDGRMVWRAASIALNGFVKTFACTIAANIRFRERAAVWSDLWPSLSSCEPVPWPIRETALSHLPEHMSVEALADLAVGHDHGGAAGRIWIDPRTISPRTSKLEP